MLLVLDAEPSAAPARRPGRSALRGGCYLRRRVFPATTDHYTIGDRQGDEALRQVLVTHLRQEEQAEERLGGAEQDADDS